MKIAVWFQGNYRGTTSFSGTRESWDNPEYIRKAFAYLLASMKINPKTTIMSPETTPNPQAFRFKDE